MASPIYCHIRGLYPRSAHSHICAIESLIGFAHHQRRLWNYAQAIAQTYPDAKRATYVAAAQTFRVPYWDWAQDAKLPTCMTTTVITINAPTGSKTITNPLYTYTFNPTTAKGFPAGDPVSMAPRLDLIGRLSSHLGPFLVFLRERVIAEGGYTAVEIYPHSSLAQRQRLHPNFSGSKCINLECRIVRKCKVLHGH